MHLKKNEFFENFKPEKEVQYLDSVGMVKERDDDYAVIEFRADTERGVVVSEMKIIKSVYTAYIHKLP